LGALAKGTLYFMFVQLVFMASGYIIHAGFGRLLGPAAYGIFGVVISLMTLVNVLLVTGIPLAGSRFIAMSNESVGAIKRAAVNLQAVLSLAVFALYFMLSPVIAGMLGDPVLSGYIRASAFVIPFYALNSLYGGFLNGLRLYGKQAIVMFVYSIAKVAGAIGLVLLGFAIYGAIIGYLLGPLIGMGIGWYYLRNTGKGSNPGNFPAKKIIDFALPVIVFSFALLFLMSTDLFLVKKILGEDAQAGYYTAASTLSKFPYYILTGLGAALFPAVSKSIASRDVVQTGKYIRESMRYLVLLLLPSVFIISGTSPSLIQLFYSSKYASASYPLSILVFGLAAFTIFSILTTVVNAAGRPQVPMLMTSALIPVAAGLNWLLISSYQLEGAAIATTITGFLGLILVWAYMLRMFGAFIEVVSFIKMLISSLIIYAVALAVPVNGVFLILWYVFLFGVYLNILVLMKEFNRNDIETFMKVLTRT
jgi:stage V sporulation protein B